MTHIADDGTVRQDHYGADRQPYDDIVEAGWAPAFAAGNVLKYLRRTKAPEHSLESARWYWDRLREMAEIDAAGDGHEGANLILAQLVVMLNTDERARLSR